MHHPTRARERTPSLGPWRGAYFDGVRAARHEVTLWLGHDGLTIEGESVGTLVWPVEEIAALEGGTEGEPVRVGLRGGDAAVAVDDPHFAESLRVQLPERTVQVRRLTVQRILGPALVALGVLVVLYVWGVPRMAERAARRVPVAWEETLGQSMVGSLLQGATVCRGDARQAALERMVDRLTADGRGGRYTYRVRVVDDPAVNALAAPGGEIVVFQGLIAQAESAEEVAGVLAHEIQHVVLQHSTRTALREIPWRLFAAAVVGDGGLAGPLSSMAMSLGSLRYQRKDESEADREGLRMLAEADVSSQGLITFLQRLEAKADGPIPLASYLSTHPTSAERVAALQAEAGAAAAGARAVLTDAEWRALAAPCGWRSRGARSALASRDQQHLARTPRERPVGERLPRLLDHETRLEHELSEAARGVEPDPVLASLGLPLPLPDRRDREEAGERVEGPVLRDDRPVAGGPPIAGEELRHDAVTAPSLPDHDAAGTEHARALGDHARIVARVVEEPEAREEVHHCVEATAPRRREPPHVGALVPQVLPGTSRLREAQQVRGEVEAIHVEPRLGKEVGVASLPAREVEHACAGGEGEQLDEARHLLAILDEVEEGLVLAHVARIEVGGPPVAAHRTRLVARGVTRVGARACRPRPARSPGQKKTGSRYAPNSASSAARIS